MNNKIGNVGIKKKEGLSRMQFVVCRMMGNQKRLESK